MSKEIPRLRMFAGPNGSGKSTLKSMVSPELLGIYVNADEIQKEILAKNTLDLQFYGISINPKELLDFLSASELLKENNSLDSLHKLHFSEGKIHFGGIKPGAYFPSVI